MALRKPNTDTQSNTAVADRPVFELDDEVVTPAVTPEVKQATSKALAEVGTRAVATTSKFKSILTELENVIPPDQAESLKRVKSGSGIIKDADGFQYGRHIDLTLISFHTQWVASPGSDADDAKGDVRFSYDGKTLTTGEPMSEYITYLKEVEGYADASVKVYTVLVGIIEGAEKPGGLVGDMVQVSLSPVSRRSFDNYRIQMSVKQARGIVPADAPVDAIRIEAESKAMGGKDFTLLKVVSRV